MIDSFVGRQAELAMLRARLADTRACLPQIVQVQGAPGIGKTALLDRFLATNPDVQVLRASGDEEERLLPYAAVEQLARTAGAEAEPLAESLGNLAGPVEDHVAVGLRILELLDRLSDRGPIAVFVDDIQWVDLPSLRSLIFTLRRLVVDPVLALIAVRAESVAELPESLRRLVTGTRGAVLRLAGLGDSELRQLAEAMGIPAFSARSAHRLHRGTEGNPLHARALLEEFPPWIWTSRDQPMPSPRSFRRVVADRRATCAPDTVRLVDAAAVLGMRSPLMVACRLGEVQDPVHALDEASKADLLQPAPLARMRMVAFPHPLIRASVYDELGPARRIRLHAVAAGLMSDQAAVLRHRIAAAPTEDAELATELADFAERQAARGAWPSAAAHLVEASRLTPDGAERQAWLLGAVNWMLLTGDAAQASMFADEIAGFVDGPLRNSVLGYHATATEKPAEAETLLRDAWRLVDPADQPELAATIALQNTVHYFGRLDGEATVEWGRRALELATPGTPTHQTVLPYLAYGLAYTGRTDEAFAIVDPTDADGQVQPGSARGLLKLVCDDLDGARAELDAVGHAASRLGILNTSAFCFGYLARAEFLAGDWDDAVLHAERAIAINVESDYGFIESMVFALATAVPAARGEWAVAEAHVAAATRISGGYERSTVTGAMASARLADARGDAAGLLDALEPVLRLAPRDAVDEPGFWPWQDLYAEALVEAGRATEADEFLGAHERRAAERDRPSAIARLARARGRVEAALGRPEPAEAAFRHGLAAIRRVSMPFEQARLELAYGEFLRRSGRRKDAIAALNAAQARLRKLGAKPYLERARTELARCGQARDGANAKRPLGLTSQELVVARLVASGRSNREVAADLVVSVKTVEFHLRNVYLKLGVGSRRQVAARLAELTDL